MKDESRGKGWVAVVVVAVALAMVGCGSASSTSYDLGSGVGGTGLTSSFNSPAEMGVGDIMPIEFLGDTAVDVDFAGVDPSARFIMVLGNAKRGGAGTAIQLSTDMAAPLDKAADAAQIEGLNKDEMSADEVMSVWMRALEFDYAFSEPVPDASGAIKALSLDAVKAVGAVETREFRMLNSLSSSLSYTTATGRVACTGDNIIFYVDTRVTGELEQSDIDMLCDEFDANLAQEQSLYGALSDVDENGKLIVFASMQVNMLGSLGGGIITGYFYAGDLYARSGSNPVSNNGEIIYTMIPDPSGRWGVSVGTDFALNNLIPAVLVHEAQHAISYNQHVFVNGGAPEDPWLNEALSHFTEDIMGLGRENPSRVALYLGNTATAGLVSSGTPNLVERGASYLFMRYLYEQHPDPASFLRALQNTSSTGVDNLEQSFNGPADFGTFSQFMARWSVALAMSGRGISSDLRYTYAERRINAMTGNWEGVCLVCDADDGRGTVLNGPKASPYYGYHTVAIDSSALKFFELTTVPDNIIVEGNGDIGDFGVLIRTE